MDNQNLWERAGLVEVLNSQDANYIHIASSLLAKYGIFVRVENELTNLITGMSIGVSLMVKKEDAEKAIKILEENSIIPNQSEAPDKLLRSMNQTQKKESHKIFMLTFYLLLVLAGFALWITFVNN